MNDWFDYAKDQRVQLVADSLVLPENANAENGVGSGVGVAGVVTAANSEPTGTTKVKKNVMKSTNTIMHTSTTAKSERCTRDSYHSMK